MFGPHVALIPFKDDEDAARIYNDTDYGLSMAVITESYRTMRFFRDECEYGMGYVNLPCIGAEVHLPFGGVKKSGNGHPSAAGLVEAVTHKTAWTVNHGTEIKMAQGLTTAIEGARRELETALPRDERTRRMNECHVVDLPNVATISLRVIVEGRVVRSCWSRRRCRAMACGSSVDRRDSPDAGRCRDPRPAIAIVESWTSTVDCGLVRRSELADRVDAVNAADCEDDPDSRSRTWITIVRHCVGRMATVAIRRRVRPDLRSAGLTKPAYSRSGSRLQGHRGVVSMQSVRCEQVLTVAATGIGRGTEQVLGQQSLATAIEADRGRLGRVGFGDKTLRELEMRQRQKKNRESGQTRTLISLKTQQGGRLIWPGNPSEVERSHVALRRQNRSRHPHAAARRRTAAELLARDKRVRLAVVHAASTRSSSSAAAGAVIEDVDGNLFLDFTAGIAVTATGHCHPEVVAAIKDQADKLLHMSGTDFYYRPQIDLAERLAKVAPGPDAEEGLLHQQRGRGARRRR